MPNSKLTLDSIRWLLPTGLELIAYFLIGLATVLFSNFNAIEHVLFQSSDISFHQTTVHFLDKELGKLLGEKGTSTLVVGVFWGVVGVIVYTFLWLVSHFSAAVSTNFAVRKYIYPKGADPNQPLKAFFIRSLFRLVSTLVLLFYLHLFVQVLLPQWAWAFQHLVQRWPELGSIGKAVLMLIVEIGALHAIAILLRLALLRTRVFR